MDIGDIKGWYMVSWGLYSCTYEEEHTVLSVPVTPPFMLSTLHRIHTVITFNVRNNNKKTWWLLPGALSSNDKFIFNHTKHK